MPEKIASFWLTDNSKYIVNIYFHHSLTNWCQVRVLSRIYHLGEKSGVAELPRGVRGHAYTVMITIFWRGEASTCVPSNTVDRTLQSNHKGKFHKKTQTTQWTSQNSANSCSRCRERENVCVTIGFGFTSDWMTKWREIFQPITSRGKVNRKLRKCDLLLSLKWQLWIALLHGKKTLLS